MDEKKTQKLFATKNAYEEAKKLYPDVVETKDTTKGKAITILNTEHIDYFLNEEKEIVVIHTQEELDLQNILQLQKAD